MTPELDVVTLRLIVAVAESGSLNAAAAQLGISQPAASGRIRAFESRWQLSLLHRSPRGSALTTDGRAVVSWARTVLHQADFMRASMVALNQDRQAGVKIAASLTVAEFIMPRWLGELRTRRPGLQPKLRVVNSETVAELVRSASVDVGFIETLNRPIGLECHVIGWDKMIAVVHPQHSWARRRTNVPVSKLLAESWVLREPGSGTRSTFERAMRQELSVALEVSSTTALVGAALAGVGPAAVSERAVMAELQTGRLVEVPTDLDLLRPLSAIWRSDQPVPDAVSDLLLIASEASRRPSQ